MPLKFNGFTVEEPSSTRVDMPMPMGDNPRRHGLISEYNPNLIDKIGNLVPDTGVGGVLKGLYSGTDRNLFGLLPSGNYETVSLESDLGEDISFLADPLALGRGYGNFNKATAPIRAKMISQLPTERVHIKNYKALNKQFDKLDIPINYVHQKPLQRTAGSYTTAWDKGSENIKMYIPNNWFKMKPYKKGAFDTLMHEKVHALQEHKGTANYIFDMDAFAYSRGKDTFSRKKTLMDFKNLPNMGKAINKPQGAADRLTLKWRAETALEDTFHPSSMAFMKKSTLGQKLRAHNKYVSEPLEVEARVGSIWGSGKLNNNRQLKDLQKAGYSNKQIEGLLWNFDKSMKRIDTQDVYNNLFNSRKSLLQQYNIK